MALSIHEVDNGRLLRDFIRLPYRIYADSSNWVPPLLSEEKQYQTERHNIFLRRNPVARFLAARDGRFVGRIAAIINRDHELIHGDHTGFFGFFDCYHDPEAARALLNTAARWVKARGAKSLRGPANFSLNNTAGLLISGFDHPPFVMMTHNHPYYRELLEQNDFQVVMRFLAYRVNSDTIRFPPVIDRMIERLSDSGIRIRPMNFKRLERDAEIIRDLFNQAWADNWGFVPAFEEEVFEDFKRIKLFARRELIMIAEKDGRPIGFSLSLPDINQVLRPLNGRLLPFNWLRLLLGLKKIDRIRVVLMGVLKEFRNRGVDLWFYRRTTSEAVKLGYHTAEMSWILENNRPMIRALEHINARPYKTYAIYEKKLPARMLSSVHRIAHQRGNGN